MPEMERRFRRDLGVAVAGFDGDQADPRNFSEAQYVTRVEGLFEIMEAARDTEEEKGGEPR
jgi:benzoyl-CoA reductase/2-hydroxyglutaryl-CoA dehydratase subunit BcrC/BadD/HgdB